MRPLDVIWRCAVDSDLEAGKRGLMVLFRISTSSSGVLNRSWGSLRIVSTSCRTSGVDHKSDASECDTRTTASSGMRLGCLANGFPSTRNRISKARREVSLNKARAAGGEISSSSRILSGGNSSGEGRKINNNQEEIRSQSSGSIRELVSWSREQRFERIYLFAISCELLDRINKNQGGAHLPGGTLPLLGDPRELCRADSQKPFLCGEALMAGER